MNCLIFLLILPLIRGDRTVTTSNGPVRGISLYPKKVEAFLGIPYAEPPVGPLRFAKPVPKSNWKELYEANELPPTCVQDIFGEFYFSPSPRVNRSEDCLYLNLWVPKHGSDLKPIMLFIHGGGFMDGSTNMQIYDGAALSERGDVIVVTINYRVGTLGFFSSSIEEAAGSMGMYDQVMAMQWVKDNGKYFGGDPENIVLFGESSGASSITLHMISPLSRNLFKRAILQSGSAIHPAYYEDRGLETSQRVAEILECADDNETLYENPKAVVDCMKALPPENFSEANRILVRSGGSFLPVIGDEFLPESTIDAFSRGNFKDVELLIGVNRNEGSFFLTLQLAEALGLFGEIAETVDFNKTFAKQLMQNFTNNDKIVNQYLDLVKKDSKYTYLTATAEFLGDFVITCCAVFQADYHSLRDNPVYFYLFNYRSPSTPMAEWMGVTHFDEVQYVFGNPVHQKFTEKEIGFSWYLMDMWAAFAKTGYPNIRSGVEWPLYTYQDPKYFVIGKKNRPGVTPDNLRCEVWRETFRTVIDKDIIRRLKKPT